MNTIIIKENDANQTVFKFLKKAYSTTPLSVIYKWFRKKDIKLNGKRISDQKIILKAGDELTIYDSNETKVRDNFVRVDISELEVVYEDDNILVVNKPSNVEVHSEYNDSLDNMVKSYLFYNGEYKPEEESSFMISHVHRLDKLTQGLVIYAKNKVALQVMLDAIKDKNAIEKFYLLETGPGFPSKLNSKGYIYYDPEEQVSIYDVEDYDDRMKTSETNFSLINSFDDHSLVEAQLLTGRKHQIRATLSYYKYPILNDYRYGGVKLNNERMIFLKAYKLIFRDIKEPLSYLNGGIIELDYDFN